MASRGDLAGDVLTRRELLGLLGAGSAALALPGCSVSPPLSSAKTAAIMDAEPWGGLATSFGGDRAYAPCVEGSLPDRKSTRLNSSH